MPNDAPSAPLTPTPDLAGACGALTAPAPSSPPPGLLSPKTRAVAQHLADGAAHAIVALDAALEQTALLSSELHAMIGSERLHEDTAGHVRGILQALASARIEARAARESVLLHGVGPAKGGA